MPLAQQKQTTIEEYEALPADIRAEVYDGQLQLMAAPSQIHQTILLELSTMLNLYLKAKKGPCTLLLAPFDVMLNETPLTIVQPDLLIVCEKAKLNGKRCNGAPDFIAEIVSPGTSSNDYIRKLYYYKSYGVREYWIIDPSRKAITVNYFEKDMVSIPYTFHSVIKVNLYDDLYIDFNLIDQILEFG